MKRIYFMHSFLQMLLERQGAYKDSEQIDAAIYFAMKARFKELYGNDAEYAPDKPLPRRAYQITQGVADGLQPFLREVYFSTAPDSYAPLPVSKLEGNVFALPDGWVHPTAIRAFTSKITPIADVPVVDDDKVMGRLNSNVKAPDATHPICEMIARGYALYPVPPLLYVKYLGLPVRPKYATMVDQNLPDPVYVDKDSIDIEFPEIEDNGLLMKAAELLAVTARDAVVPQFARYQAEKGT